MTAQVTASTSGLKSVILYENYPNDLNHIKRTAPMAVGSDGITYSATVPVDLNTNSNANGERLYVEAIDPANNVTDVVAATQGYDNIPPSITTVTSSPDPIPVQGATATVTAKVTDAGVGLSSVILYENYPNDLNHIKRTAPMAVGSDGITYSATVPVDLNSATGANGERLYIEAIDNASNLIDYIVATQGYSSVPATGSLPVLITADPSVPVLSPATVAPGGAILPLTIHGINFASGATVLFNGVQLQTASQTDKQLVVNVPASLVALAGSYPVSVIDPSPSGVSNSVNLIVASNSQHILWTNTSGAVSLWNMATDHSYTHAEYGPFAGWTADSVSVGSDGKTHILWNHSADGEVSLWDIIGGSYSYTLYGPFAGWTAVSVAAGQ